MEFKIYTMAEIRAIPIVDLREFAKDIGVRSPTTYTKEELENAVYERIQQIDAQRKAPVALCSPRSRASLINKSLVPEEDREKYGPFKKIPRGLDAKPFKGWFRPFENGGGVISRKLLPQADDLFISQGFVEGFKLVMGDLVSGKYAKSQDGIPDVVVQVLDVNGHSISEHRAVDIFYSDKVKPTQPLEFWSDDSDLRAFALAAPVKHGSRVLLSHGCDIRLTDFNIRLVKSLKREGIPVLALFLGALPEYEKEIEELGCATACTYEIAEKYMRYAVEMLVEAAYRNVEEGKKFAVVVDNLDAIGDTDLVRKVHACGCALESGSVTVFATANEDIMDVRPYKTAESISDIIIRFKGRRGVNTVDFKGSTVKYADAEWTMLKRLSEIEGDAVDAIVRNCGTRKQAEQVLK